MNSYLDRLIDLALDEDLGSAGDVTTSALVPPGALGTAELWAKEPMVLSGLGAFVRTFEKVDPSVKVKLEAKDGDEDQQAPAGGDARAGRCRAC